MSATPPPGARSRRLSPAAAQLLEQFTEALGRAGLGNGRRSPRVVLARSFLADHPDPATWTQDHAKWWIAAKRHLAPSTAASYHSTLRSLLACLAGQEFQTPRRLRLVPEAAQLLEQFTEALGRAGLANGRNAARVNLARSFLADHPDPATWTQDHAEAWVAGKQLTPGSAAVSRSYLRSLMSFLAGEKLQPAASVQLAPTAARTAERLAQALEEIGVSEVLISRRLSAVRSFLADRPDPATWTEDHAREWVAAKGLTQGTAEVYRSHLRSLLAFLAGEQAAQPHRLQTAVNDVPPEVRAGLAPFRQWLIDHGASKVSVKNRLAVVRSFLVANPDFVGLTDDQIEEWLDSHRLSNGTRATYRTHLRSLYRWAANAGLTEGTRLRVTMGPGSASSVTTYGRGRVLLPVEPAWQRAIEAWVDWQAAVGRPATTLYLREYQLRRFAHDHPRLDPFATTLDHLSSWMASFDWANSTRRSQRSALRSFYGWAHTSGRMSHDPAAGLPAVKVSRGQPKPAADERINAALMSADDRLRLMLLLGAQAGLRRTEIASLHTRCLEELPTGYALRITGKGGHERMIPVAGELLDRLRSAPDGYLFPGDHEGHLSPGTVGNLLSAALGRGLTGHSLRHRFATTVYAPSRDLLATQHLLGHTSPVTTQRYVLVPDETARALVAQASNLGRY